MTEVADEIHGYAEFGYEEVRSSALLAAELRGQGLAVTTGVADLATAFDAVLEGAADGPAVAILAEYDALPGLGHACGHNLIGAAALGAAVGLAAVKDRLRGRLHIFGTPAEEGFRPNAGGKVIMHDAGLFKKVDAVMMVHPGDPFSGGGPSLARDNFRLTFRGRRPAVGRPRWDSVDSQDAMMLTQAAINVLRQHIPPDVVIQWMIEKGGENPNIIPVESVARMYVRASKMDTVQHVVARVMDCARGAALATGGEVEYRRHAQLYDEVVLNPTINRLFTQALRDVGVPEDELGEAPTGPVQHSNDMGIITKNVPSMSGRIIVGPRGLVMHTKEATEATNSPAGHRGMVIGAKSMALVAWRLANDPKLMEQARRDLAAAT
ncbi:MAG: amidohydrolase [Bacillota bacterium]|nr:amidohydrolase [Bacillota bacterium]